MNWSSTEQPAWRDRGNITGKKESRVKQKFDDKGCVWSCGGKVRFLGCLETWLLFFMVWEVSSVMVQDTWKITHFMWSWAMCSADPAFEQGLWTECTPEVPPTPAVLCCCGSNFGICPQSCFNISLLGDFPLDRNQYLVPWNCFFSRQWLILTTYLEVSDIFVLSVTKSLFENHNFLLFQWFYPSAGWKSPQRLSLTKATSGESPCL